MLDAILKIGGVFFAIVIILLLLIFCPLLSIWALNTLFPVLAIPYTLKTWFAIIVAASLFKTNVKIKKD